jgi:hypothetical protein
MRFGLRQARGRRTFQAGMNVFELLSFLFNLICAVILAAILEKSWGNWGLVLGSVLGFSAGIAFIYSFSFISKLFHMFRPLRPECKTGRCSAKDYKLLEVYSDGGLFGCRCGDRYLRKGEKFLELSADGIARPYMKRGSFGKWIIDS